MTKTASTCPACGGATLTEIYRLDAIPVQSCILLDSAEEARNFPRRPLVMKFCDDCGFVFNAAFDLGQVDYASTTEESQHFSGTFNRFAKDLAAEVASLYDLKGKRTLEIGCGKGEFLQELAQQTGTRGLGVDPGFIPERLPGADGQDIVFQREYFDPTTIAEAPDFVVCRHTLEHIPAVGRFMEDIATALRGRRDVGIFFETPDVRRVLDEGAFWDIYYEHCSYFTLGSHARLFRRAGMDVTRLYLAYDDQYIIQYAEPAAGHAPLPEEDDLDAVRALAGRFPEKVAEIRAYWTDFVRSRHATGKRVAIWGGGSKGVSFLTTNDLGDEVAQVIDINPFKQGRYLPGTGHLVSGPDSLKDAPPDTVIVMNPIYLPEIGADMAKMGLEPELVAVWMSLRTTCPVCGNSHPVPVFKLGNMPVICNQLWADADAARAAPSGDVDLVRCPDCAMIWNATFEPARMVYAPGYENALHFSPRFQAFAEDLAQGLVARFDLHDKHVFEIGCGDGHMLDLMAKHGVATATGFDPSMEGIETPFAERAGVEIVPEYFRSDQLDRHFDAILCRHVLEHLDTPMPLLHDIRRAIGARDVPIYFEVPNAGWMLDAHSLWDVIYEHVGYWTEPALLTAFRRAGFRPTRIATGYDGQFLMIEARPADAEPGAIAPGVEEVATAAEAFAVAAAAEISRLSIMLGALKGRAVIWGAGSKGITFANVLGADAVPLAAMVDLNPRKHGLYAPSAALPVVSPDALRDLDPALVLISNALYKVEISSQVAGLGLTPDVAVIAG